MAALGRFVRVDEELFRRRVHASSSRQGHTNLDQVARWFDTSRSRAPRAPRLHLAVATAKALVSLPITRSQRIVSAMAFLGVYGLRRARIGLGRVRADLQRRQV
jgi:hypothetical protein